MLVRFPAVYTKIPLGGPSNRPTVPPSDRQCTLQTPVHATTNLHSRCEVIYEQTHAHALCFLGGRSWSEWWIAVCMGSRSERSWRGSRGHLTLRIRRGNWISFPRRWRCLEHFDVEEESDSKKAEQLETHKYVTNEEPAPFSSSLTDQDEDAKDVNVSNHGLLITEYGVRISESNHTLSTSCSRIKMSTTVSSRV